MIEISQYFFRYRFLFPLPLYILCFIYASYDKTNFYAGFTLILSGMVLRFYTVGFIGAVSRNLAEPAADQFIKSGPYRRVRNPIYESNILIYSGFTVLSNVFFPYLTAFSVLYFWSAYTVMIFREEDFLRKTYGIAYIEYCETTSRWIPRLRTTSMKTGHTKGFSAARAIRSERSTWIACTAALTAILVRMLM